MKVLLLNGSPHACGCTNRALREIAEQGIRCGISIKPKTQPEAIRSLLPL